MRLLALLAILLLLLAGCSSPKEPADDGGSSSSTQGGGGGGGQVSTRSTAAGPAPTVVFTVDESFDQLLVDDGTSADADWNRLSVIFRSAQFADAVRMG